MINAEIHTTNNGYFPIKQKLMASRRFSVTLYFLLEIVKILMLPNRWRRL